MEYICIHDITVKKDTPEIDKSNSDMNDNFRR